MNNKLNYFISRTSIFCVGFHLLFTYAYQNAWLCVILGTLIGIISLYIINKLNKYFNKYLLILFNIYLIFIVLLILPLFVNSFYLVNTPKIVINTSLLLIAIYSSFKSREVLNNISKLLYYISIVLIIVFSLLLIKYIDLTNFYPLLNITGKDILLTSLMYASITSIPSITLINYKDNFKYVLKDYLISSLTILIITIMIILALGMPLITIYSFPEYAVLRQIEYFNFIENIENISSTIWYIDMFITLGVLCTNLKELINNKIILSIIYILILILASTIGYNYSYVSSIFMGYSIGLGIFLLIFIANSIFKKINSL